MTHPPTDRVALEQVKTNVFEENLAAKRSCAATIEGPPSAVPSVL